MSDIVRKQLMRAIKTKANKVDSLKEKEQEFKAQAAEVAEKRKAIQAEVKELTTHLDGLGGPLAPSPRGRPPKSEGKGKPGPKPKGKKASAKSGAKRGPGRPPKQEKEEAVEEVPAE